MLLTNESVDSSAPSSLSGREWREAYTVSFAKRRMAFALHAKDGNVYQSRIVRIGDVKAEDMTVFCQTRKQKIVGGEADIMLYPNPVPFVDVWASVSDLGVEWNVRLKGPDAPRVIEFEAEVPFDTPNAQGEIASTDAAGNWADIVTKTERKTNGAKETMVTIKEFNGRVSVRDQKTRKRSWSNDVKYPVRVR